MTQPYLTKKIDDPDISVAGNSKTTRVKSEICPNLLAVTTRDATPRHENQCMPTEISHFSG
jgi:hypothetical protein